MIIQRGGHSLKRRDPLSAERTAGKIPAFDCELKRTLDTQPMLAAYTKREANKRFFAANAHRHLIYRALEVIISQHTYQ